MEETEYNTIKAQLMIRYLKAQDAGEYAVMDAVDCALRNLEAEMTA